MCMCVCVRVAWVYVFVCVINGDSFRVLWIRVGRSPEIAMNAFEMHRHL